MVAAIGDAAPERRARLDEHRTERRVEAAEAGERSGGPGEAPADHAHRLHRFAHFESPSLVSWAKHSHTQNLRRQ
jgi:hypothetical protein